MGHRASQQRGALQRGKRHMKSPTRAAFDRAAARVRAVTLDAGGTLITCHPSVGEIYAEVAARNGVRGLDPAELNHRFAAAFEAHPQFTHTRAQWAALVDATFEGLVPEPPSHTFFPQLYKRFAEPGSWRVYPDVLPALRDLRARGLKLGSFPTGTSGSGRCWAGSTWPGISTPS